MAANSGIQWTTHTFNPWRGCSKVSEGCRNCYAETLSQRNPLTLGVWGPSGTRVVASEAMWREPLKWSKAAACTCGSTVPMSGHWQDCPQSNRPRVFPSLCDPFEDWQGPMVDAKGKTLMRCTHNGCTAGGFHDVDFVPGGSKCIFCFRDMRPLTMSDVRRRLFELIDNTPALDWLLLTKRPENIGKMMPPTCDFCSGFQRLRDTHRCQCGGSESKNCRPNLWLGTSVENQATADERIPHLLRVPAAVRFLSVEPLLGPVDLTRVMQDECRIDARDGSIYKDDLLSSDPTSPSAWPVSYTRQLNWVIIGGESGPGARPCRVEWIRDLVRQCKAAGVPCFVKQLGSNVTSRLPVDEIEVWPNHDCGTGPVQFSGDGFGNYHVLGLRDRKGGDPAEWPADLRVRELPTGGVTCKAN